MFEFVLVVGLVGVRVFEHEHAAPAGRRGGLGEHVRGVVVAELGQRPDEQVGLGELRSTVEQSAGLHDDLAGTGTGTGVAGGQVGGGARLRRRHEQPHASLGVVRAERPRDVAAARTRDADVGDVAQQRRRGERGGGPLGELAVQAAARQGRVGVDEIGEAPPERGGVARAARPHGVEQADDADGGAPRGGVEAQHLGVPVVVELGAERPQRPCAVGRRHDVEGVHRTPDELVPVLRRRGILRREYTGAGLRTDLAAF